MTKKNKLLIVIACECVILVTLITGTIAWLTAKSETVTNTFTPSNISISLTETKGDNVEFKMIPGAVIEKDPKVTVEANSEACYVFVEIKEDLGAWEATGKLFANYLEYNIAPDWTALSDETGVYYRLVSTSEDDQPFQVLNENKVTVKNTVTKDDMEKLYIAGAEMPTLKFTAYAIQQNYLTDTNGTEVTTPEGAWAILKAGN